jgi:hypothetical protein
VSLLTQKMPCGSDAMIEVMINLHCEDLTYANKVETGLVHTTAGISIRRLIYILKWNLGVTKLSAIIYGFTNGHHHC